MSFDATSAASVDHDSLTRFVPQPSSPSTPKSLITFNRTSSLMTDHEHGLGLSGLHRIRQQQPPSRNPTLAGSNASSRSPSVVALSRTPSLSAVLSHTNSMPLSTGPASPSFSEDLSRFPSESLHSFSFAHQSEDFIHNRQNVLKRSVEFMKDRMGWPMSSAQAGLASAQARVTGDVETQNMLDLLARAQLIGAGNLPHSGSQIDPGPLTGPAHISGENVFDKQFMPRSSSPEPMSAVEALSPTAAVVPTSRAPPSNSQHVHFNEAQSSKLPQKPAALRKIESEESSRTPTNESATTAATSPPTTRPTSLKRTMTDTLHMNLEDRLMDTMAQPFYQDGIASPTLTGSTTGSTSFPSALGPSVHGNRNRWVPAAQAIFTTEAKPPWTIIAANDLACLVFGVTKAEVRKTGILEVVQEERRAWLERKLLNKGDEDIDESRPDSRGSTPASSAASALLGSGGITAQLLSKPNSRTQSSKPPERRANTVHSGDPNPPRTRGSGRHRSALSRGVILCGDVVPIQKRNGATGSASLWVKEKRVGLIWVLEEIHEDTAFVDVDEEGVIKGISGDTWNIWGIKSTKPGLDVGALIPRIPRQGINPNTGEIDFAQTRRRRFFTCPNLQKVNVPCTIEQVRGKLELRVSSFPHIAGMIVLDPRTLHIRSSNAVFSGALFGFDKPDGMSVNALIPGFDKILEMLTDHEGIELMEGMVIPEDRFRRASGLLAIREHRPDVSEVFLKPDGLPAKHRDGSDLKIDVQMRVVKSEKQNRVVEETVIEGSDEENDSNKDEDSFIVPHSEMVYALWITYSRNMHTEAPPNLSSLNISSDLDAQAGAPSPLHQPSPGQTPPIHTPAEITSDEEEPKSKTTSSSSHSSKASIFSKQIKDGVMNAAARFTGQKQPPPKAEEKQEKPASAKPAEPPTKKTIEDYTILEDMGQGAYGQVKLARDKKTGKKAVLKYVTKRRILVDTWTRDRKLGTVPLEIHVLDYLRKPEFQHPNIVEMEGFFEDSVNYYIEMKPHGLPGMDLFDYIELRANMEESECRSIFKQVAQAIHFLHMTANVVHRDIKDENVILDGEGNIKLIDFGSAAYIKSGPFDVFVGTIGT